MQRGRYFNLGLLAVGAVLTLGFSRPVRADVPGWQEKSFNEGVPGNAKVDGDKIVIQGSGADTWEKSDGFYIVYKPLKGDGSVTTKLLAAEEGSEWSKTGVMMRNDLDDLAAAVSENEMTSAHGTENIIRAVGGAVMSKDNKFTVDGGAETSPREFPRWLKIERRGDRVQQLISLDGSFWYPVTRALQMQMKDEIVAGLFVCSHDDSSLLTGTFDLASSDVSPTLLKPEQVSPSQPYPVNVTSGDNMVILSWSPVNHLGADATGYAIYKSPVTSGAYADLQFTKIADLTADKTFFVDDKVKNGELAAYQVRTVVKIGDKTLESDTINKRMLFVEGTANPTMQIANTAYQHTVLDDLGEANITSSAGKNEIDANGVLTQTAAGDDFWERGDGGTALLTKVASDFTLTARILGAPQADGGGDPNEWAKTGIMVRENTSGESRMVTFVANAAHGLQAIRRVYNSGRGENDGDTSVDQPYPVWVRIQRTGDKIDFSTSTDGTTYKPFEKGASTTLPSLSKEVYVGFATTAHDNSALAVGKMDNLKLEIAPQ